MKHLIVTADADPVVNVVTRSQFTLGLGSGGCDTDLENPVNAVHLRLRLLILIRVSRNFYQNQSKFNSQMCIIPEHTRHKA